MDRRHGEMLTVGETEKEGKGEMAVICIILATFL